MNTEELILSIWTGVSVTCILVALLYRMRHILQLATNIDETASSRWESTSWKPFFPVIRVLAPLFSRFEGSSTSKRVYQLLETLGNPLRLTYADFLAICMIASVALGLFGVLAGAAVGYLMGTSIKIALAVGVFGVAAGFGLPWFYLSSDASERVRSINKDLPYALDMLLLIIEGGGSVQEGLEVVARESSYGALREEFALVNQEVAHGAVLVDALGNLARRIPSDDIVVIVQAIGQGIRMGTPLARVLQEQSDLLRLKRTQRAEKLAKEAASKMTFPVVLIMVATFILVMGPAVIQFNSSSFQ